MSTMTIRKPCIGLLVAHSNHQRVVPPVTAPWQYHQPFEPDEQTEFEPVPKHDSYLLDLKI